MSWGNFREGAVLSRRLALTLALAGLGGLTAPREALAQVASPGEAATAKLVTVLTIGLPCDASDTVRDAIRDRSIEADAPDEDLQAALDHISADETFCEPIRNAASLMAADRTIAAAGAAQASDRAALTASAALVAQALDQADKLARERGFQVGPPPRNLTRGRISGS
jgi:hypothetical protein